MEKHHQELQVWLLRAFTGALVMAVLVQSAFQMEKYLSGKTILGQTVKKYEELPLPAVSFCPGFKTEVARYKKSQKLQKRTHLENKITQRKVCVLLFFSRIGNEKDVALNQ